MKKVYFLNLFISFFLFFGGCDTKESSNIKISAILPLTGSAAQWGVPCKNASQMAVDEINASGGIKGRKVVITYEDTQAEPSKGVSAIQKIIDIDKPIAILGEVASSVSLAITPVAEKNKLVVISPASTSPKLTNAGDYFFRVIPTDKLRSEVFANYIFNKGFILLDIIYINNDGGVGALSAFIDEYQKIGGKVITKYAYTPEIKDFRSQLSKAKQSETEAIMIISYPEDTALLLRQIKEIKLNKKVFALTEALDDPNIITKCSGAAEGVEYIVPSPTTGLVSEKFAKNYKVKYNVAPPTFAAESYDIIYILKKAILLKNEISPENIKNSLYNIKDFNGASGIITFDKNGDVIKPMSVKTIINNNSKVIN